MKQTLRQLLIHAIVFRKRQAPAEREFTNQADRHISSLRPPDSRHGEPRPADGN
jgi:hypothetical protein